MPDDLRHAIDAAIGVAGAFRAHRAQGCPTPFSLATCATEPAELLCYEHADFGVTTFEYDPETLGRANMFANFARCNQVFAYGRIWVCTENCVKPEYADARIQSCEHISVRALSAVLS